MGFNLNMEKLAMSGGFGFPHMKIGVVQGQHDAEMNLLARPNITRRR